MHDFRRRLWLSGLGGLLADGLLAAASAWLVSADIVRPPLPYPLLVTVAAVVLGGFSLAEVPLMVLAMRQLAAERPNNPALVLIVNAVFCFFAGVYGVPLILVAGSVGWGLALCALGLLRLAASVLFVRVPREAGL